MSIRRLDRRLMLRSAGVALGLPMLEAMAVSPVCRGVAELPAEPRRLVLVGQPLGMYGPNFFPQQSGPQFEASRYLSAVERHRGQLTVFSGMSHHYPAGHFAEVALFTGVAPERIRENDIRNGISLEQEAAALVGRLTRFPSLVLGGGNASWNGRGVRIPSESRATQVFRRLFLAGTAEDEARELQRLRDGQSVLDSVGSQISSLTRRVGRADRQRLELFLGSVREAEQMLQQDEQWAQTPKPTVSMQAPTSEFGGAQLLERSRQWYSLVHLALQTDSTRSVSLWLGTQDRPEIPGVNLGHHDASHHGQDPAKLEQLALIEEAEMRVLGEFLDRLRETQEDGETLLDRTAVLYASNLGNSSSHDNSNLPVLLAGGRFRHQGHVVSDLRNNVRMSNLFVRMLRHLGQEAERFGASDGVISEI
jgi:hypothetical protein